MIVKQSGELDTADPGAITALCGPAQLPAPPQLHPGVAGVLQALADPMRLAIVRRLAAGTECPCGALGLPISKSTLSHHLHVLRAAGIVVQREEGTRRMTKLDRAGLDRRFPGLLEAVLAARDPELPPTA
ncbi:MAG TPA: helix-turn-helix transcriptional regulator [Candidatus Binatia bacterium]|nr:helix-turn-helix transcriptional regulator [Candidatus Binatia bacterium]